MRNRFFIYFLGAGIVAASFLSGCNSEGASYCSEGVDFYGQAQYQKAVESFEKAVSADGDNAQYLVYLGMAMIETGDYLGATENFNSAISIEEDNRDAYRGLGLVSMYNGDINEAIVNFLKVENLSAKYDAVCIDAMKYMAGCYFELGNYIEAVDVYTRILSALDKDDKQDKCYIHYLRGCCYIKLNDESNAALDYEEAIKLNGADYELCCNMYYYFKEAGYQDRAESYLKRIIQADDADSFLKGKIYYILEDYAQAETYLLSAYDDGNKEAAYYLAMTYEKNQDYVNAENLYKEYLSEHPNDYGIYNQYGAYMIGRGNYENALVYIETGLELAKEDEKQELLYNQAVCYEYIGDFDKAYQLFGEYVLRYPTDADAKKELEFLSSR